MQCRTRGHYLDTLSFKRISVNATPILSPMKSYPAGVKCIASSQKRICSESQGKASYKSKTWLRRPGQHTLRTVMMRRLRRGPSFIQAIRRKSLDLLVQVVPTGHKRLISAIDGRPRKRNGKYLATVCQWDGPSLFQSIQYLIDFEKEGNITAMTADQ